MKKSIFLLFLLSFYKIDAEQFIYPVADFDQGHRLMLVYQKSLSDVELWMWDTQTHQAIKGLSSFITPANLRILPSGTGFSFIDQGYIKIKEFHRRSSKTLPIYEAIGLFSSMNWIDEHSFYFVAREGEYFQIFQSDVDANIMRLTNESADTLYPQKIDDQLFYIQRNDDGKTSIIKQAWHPLLMTDFNQEPEKEVIKSEKSKSLCFLQMINDQEGFYLEAPTQKIKKETDCYQFNCYNLKLHENNWINQKLFSFTIPAKYITGSNRLYESIEPFLPNYTCKDFIYFSDFNIKSKLFELKKINIITKSIEIIQDQGIYRSSISHIFAPHIVHNKIYCGLIVPENLKYQSIATLFAAENVQIQLPEFDTAG